MLIVLSIGNYLAEAENQDRSRQIVNGNKITADAGPSQIVGPGSLAVLDASNSFSNNNDGIVSYFWNQIQGDPIYISDIRSVSPSFITPDVNEDGEALVFQLTVTNDHGEQANDSCIVNVSNSNMPPTAMAEAELTVSPGMIAYLDASNSSDLDDGISSFQWSQLQGTTVNISEMTSIRPFFIAPDVQEGGEALVFQLTVTDYNGLMAKDICIINVTTSNQPPVADAGGDIVIIEKDQVVLTGANSYDQDNELISFNWVQTAGYPVSLSNPNIENPTFTAPSVENNGKELYFRLIVRDKMGLASIDKVSVIVLDEGFDIEKPHNNVKPFSDHNDNGGGGGDKNWWECFISTLNG